MQFCNVAKNMNSYVNFFVLCISSRKYLCDVVRIKLKCYEVSKTRIQSAEEYLRHFLEAEVKNLWPAGWMQSRYFNFIIMNL